MRYVNESEKSVRKRNYYLTVFVFPVAIGLAVGGFIYLLNKANVLTGNSRYYGYFFSMVTAMMLFAYREKSWLKLPDGSYRNIKNETNLIGAHINEPKIYEEIYFASTGKKINLVIFGFVILFAGILLALKIQDFIFLPMALLGFGSFLSWQGLSGVSDRSPKLKLAKRGLWTRNLGFRDWQEITQALVVEEKKGSEKESILEIYLNGVSDKPVERLFLTELEDHQYIEMVIENLISKRNSIED